MSGIIDKLNKFNYTKAGVITGFILGTIMSAIGILFMVSSFKKNDGLLKCSSFVVLGIGISCIVVEIYRSKKLTKRQ